MLTALLVLCGCSPSLDWREVRPEASGAQALFPCKPSTDSRVVTLAGAGVRMSVTACRAGDVTWALAFADTTDPTRVAPALAALREASAANVGGAAQIVGPVRIQGMTPNARADRVRMKGQLPDGQVVTLESAFFVKGTRVYQATVMGAAPADDAVATFFDSLKLPS